MRMRVRMRMRMMTRRVEKVGGLTKESMTNHGRGRHLRQTTRSLLTTTRMTNRSGDRQIALVTG